VNESDEHVPRTCPPLFNPSMLLQAILWTRSPLAACFAPRFAQNTASFSFRHIHKLSFPRRHLSASPTTAAAQTVSTPAREDKPTYHGPLTSTFTRLKIFSLSSLTLSGTLAPFMFLIESNLPLTARFALASIAIGTSGISTGLVSWCGMPYVTTLRRLKPEENAGAEGVEMTTLNLFLRPKITTVRHIAILLFVADLRNFRSMIHHF
jgi:hypothetical protein